MRVLFAVVGLAVLMATLVGVLTRVARPSSSRLEAFGPSRRVLSETQSAFRPAVPLPGIIPASAALSKAGGVRRRPEATDIHYSLVFGRFTDRDLSITNRSVWILTTTGVYVAEGHGLHAIRRPAEHEGDIVIDARTGQYIEAFGD